MADGTWNQLLAGDIANLDGSGSVFTVTEPDSELLRRCDEMDIHPTGTLFGDGSPLSSSYTGHESWLAALQGARVKPARRSLRLRVADLGWSGSEDSPLLEFTLPRGAFATSVLREIAEVHDQMR